MSRRVFAVEESAGWCAELLENWRLYGDVGRILLLAARYEEAPSFRNLFEKGDVVVAEEDAGVDVRMTTLGTGFGLADLSFFHIGSRTDLSGPRRQSPWAFYVPRAELDSAIEMTKSSQWERTAAPSVDWIARWITGREIGIALGAGAALGLAHLGVLAVLEEAGINIDYICGSSMGGAAALLYAKSGSVQEAIELSRDIVGGNDRVIDVAWFPRSSLLAGKKHEQAAVGVYGTMQIAELEKPAAAVAADLVRGERFVFEQGPAAIAARATTAIPGIFPPVSYDGRLLVDGALVSRIPMDLLIRRRCGLKLAVNVIPALGKEMPDGDWSHARLQKQFNRLLGLRYVIANSWQLLGWWQGAWEAEGADVLFEPLTDHCSGFDFGSINDLIEAGRAAAREKLDMTRRSVAELLKPGAP